MNRWRLVVLAMALGLAWSGTALAAEPVMQEGQWEIDMTVEMPGMPFKMPAIKSTMCMTKEDVVPQKPDPQKNCVMKEQKVEGNTVTWAIECKDEDGTTKSNGQVTYKNDSFTGAIDSTISSKDGVMETHQKMSGRRLGPCP